MTVQRAQAPVAGTRPWLDILGTAARLGVGGVLVAAGALKVANLPLSAFAVRAYQLLPYELAGYVGYALPVVELLVGALLLAGLFTRWAALAASVLMAGFVVGIGWAWATGLGHRLRVLRRRRSHGGRAHGIPARADTRRAAARPERLARRTAPHGIRARQRAELSRGE